MSEKRKLANKLNKAKFDLKNVEAELRNVREMPPTPGEYIGEHSLVAMRAWAAALREYVAKLESGVDAERPDNAKVTGVALKAYDDLHFKAEFTWETFLKMMEHANPGNKYGGEVPFYAIFQIPDELYKRMPQLLAWQDERRIDLHVANDPDQVLHKDFLYKFPKGDPRAARGQLYYVAIREGGVLEPQKPEKPAKKRGRPKNGEKKPVENPEEAAAEVEEEETQAALEESEEEEEDSDEAPSDDNVPVATPVDVTTQKDFADDPKFALYNNATQAWVNAATQKPSTRRNYYAAAWEWPGWCLAHNIDFFGNSLGQNPTEAYARYFNERFSLGDCYIVNTNGQLRKYAPKKMSVATNIKNLHIRLVAELSTPKTPPDLRLAKNYLDKKDLLNFLSAEDIRSIKKAGKAKKSYHDSLKPEEVRSIWDHIKVKGTEDDKLLFKFAIDVGFRAEEMADFQWKQLINNTSPQILVPKEKTKREKRLVPIPFLLYNELTALRDKRAKEGNGDETDYVFLKPRTNEAYMKKPTLKMLEKAVSKERAQEILAAPFDPKLVDFTVKDTYIVDSAALGLRLAGFIEDVLGKEVCAARKLTTHCLRATFCTRMWDQVRDIVKVALLMGHQMGEGTPNLQMTQQYIHLDWEQLRAFYVDKEKELGTLDILQNITGGLFVVKTIEEVLEPLATTMEKIDAIEKAMHRTKDPEQQIELGAKYKELVAQHFDLVKKTALPETQELVKQIQEKERQIKVLKEAMEIGMGSAAKDVKQKIATSAKVERRLKTQVYGDYIDKAHQLYQEKNLSWKQVKEMMEEEGRDKSINYWRRNCFKRYPLQYADQIQRLSPAQLAELRLPNEILGQLGLSTIKE